MFQRLSKWSMNSKSTGDNGSEKTALMRLRIQKLQVIRSKRFPVMTGAMTRMTSWNMKAWVSKRQSQRLTKWSDALCLMMIAKICCLRSQKGLRTFTWKIENNLQLKYILKKACKYFWINSLSKNTCTCTSTRIWWWWLCYMLKRIIWTSACFAKPTSSAFCSWWWLCYVYKYLVFHLKSS